MAERLGSSLEADLERSLGVVRDESTVSPLLPRAGRKALAPGSLPWALGAGRTDTTPVACPRGTRAGRIGNVPGSMPLAPRAGRKACAPGSLPWVSAAGTVALVAADLLVLVEPLVVCRVGSFPQAVNPDTTANGLTDTDVVADVVTVAVA